MDFAQVDLLSSTSALVSLLTGGLIGIGIAAYRFFVNFRLTERGMARQRIRQANHSESRAKYEASLWQDRCADLQWIMKNNGLTVPPLGKELQIFVDASTEADKERDTVDWNGIAPPSNERPRP